MLHDTKIVAFLATAQPDRSLAFYRDVLGLRFVADEPYALVFEAGGTMVRIQKAPNHRALPYTALGFRVDDIRAQVRELSRTLRFERFDGFDQDELGIWTVPDGTRIAWFKDPDENLLSLAEFADHR